MTIYIPIGCDDPELKPVYDRAMTALRLACKVDERVIIDPLTGEKRVWAAQFDGPTVQKKLDEIPFWLRKMIGL